ncbi:GNAT family N-acetyltransferase [Kitasatospora brasiliensis]|uniref:GNAT family N-acetyltransferase n=1 Tax=Kitasatospora brasiliensis TaxID=3058040 RepID=UPI002930A524|nr:GNAT family N-acetyltransferase [Kitasatospora sp. K002]
MHDNVRRMAAGEWRELRGIALEALRDSPSAFSLSYAECAARPDDYWQHRAAREATARECATFAAIVPAASAPGDAAGGEAGDEAGDETGRWVGITAVEPLPDVPDTVHIHSVYVAPAYRGSAGPAAALVRAAVRHAREHTDVGALTLGVHEDNERAQAFYRRLGFEPTGKVVPYVRRPQDRILVLGYPDFRA